MEFNDLRVVVVPLDVGFGGDRVKWNCTAKKW
jgi:hypothetical protein